MWLFSIKRRIRISTSCGKFDLLTNSEIIVSLSWSLAALKSTALMMLARFPIVKE